MTKVKICGIRRPQDVEMINHLMPDYAGFVFAKSKRQVQEDQALRLREQMRPEISAVGVFVQEDVERIVRLCRTGTIQMIQLHGGEDEAYIQRLHTEVPEVPVIKAVRVKSGEQILEEQMLPCEYLLLDTYVSGVYGGSGQQFDKRLIPELKKPFFLAGGLDGSNVQENIRICHPYAVDVSSAVETDGVKDFRKIEQFLRMVRGIE